jgi:hypothetical protein
MISQFSPFSSRAECKNFETVSIISLASGKQFFEDRSSYEDEGPRMLAAARRYVLTRREIDERSKWQQNEVCSLRYSINNVQSVLI